MTESTRTNATVSRLPRRPCPRCAKPAQVRWRPFCSKRCADLDLAGWLTEAYRITLDEDPDTEQPDEDAG